MTPITLDSMTRARLHGLVLDEMARLREYAARSVSVKGFVCYVHSHRLAYMQRALRELNGKPGRVLRLEELK